MRRFRAIARGAERRCLMISDAERRETVRDPGWYTSGAVETIAKIDPAVDLGKANNYAHRLITGDWRCDGGR